MLTSDLKRITSLIDIAARAIEVDDMDSRRRVDAEALKEAYKAWKAAKGVDNIDAHSPEWEAMVTATAGEYGVLQDTKRQVANARKRLGTAIRKYRAAAGDGV